MNALRSRLFRLIAIWIVIIHASGLTAEQIAVRHIEGVTLGFLVLRNTDGEPLAYGDWKQVVKHHGIVVGDLRFQFKDGSLYEESTKFTQRGRFRLISDQVEQKGPSFKQQGESWIDVSRERSQSERMRTAKRRRQPITSTCPMTSRTDCSLYF